MNEPSKNDDGVTQRAVPSAAGQAARLGRQPAAVFLKGPADAGSTPIERVS